MYFKSSVLPPAADSSSCLGKIVKNRIHREAFSSGTSLGISKKSHRDCSTSSLIPSMCFPFKDLFATPWLFSHCFTGCVNIFSGNGQKLCCVPLTMLHFTSLWLLWSCCYKDAPILDHLWIPRALVVCTTVRTKQRSYLPNTIQLVSLWWYVWPWWQPQAENSVFPIAHTWRQVLPMCVLMMWGKFDSKCIFRFTLEIQ